MPVDRVATRAGYVPLMSVNPSATPHFPPHNPRRPHLTDFGVTGTEIMAGQIINEEFNRELQGKLALRTYDSMRRIEPQIFSTLLMIELPIRSAEWKVAPATNDPADLEIAAAVETTLFHELRRSWDDFLRHAMMHLWNGFMLFEVTWENVNGVTMLRDLSPRLPRTVHKWYTEPRSGDFLGIQQWAYTNNHYEYKDIPADVLLHFAHRQEGNNLEGISILRTAYKPFFYKQTFERLQAVGFEREWVGIPVVSLPPGYTDNDLSHARQMGKNIRSHEQAFVTLPPEWAIEWLKGGGGGKGKGTSIQDTLYYLDRQMQQNVLAQFMSLGTTDVGSYALSNDQSRVFLMGLQATARYIADVVNANVVRRFVNYNYNDVAVYPKVVFQKVHAYNFVDLTQSIANLVGTQVIPVTAELEDYIYDLLGVPIAPRSVVEMYNPTASSTPRGTPILRPDSNIAPVGGDKDESAGGVGFSETYNTPRFRAMSGNQRAIYARMAEEAGRPRTVIRLGGHQWVSGTPKLLGADPKEKNAGLLERRIGIAEAARKSAEESYEDLLEEVENILNVPTSAG